MNQAKVGEEEKIMMNIKDHAKTRRPNPILPCPEGRNATLHLVQ
jgi:hypothetical protein